MERCRSAKDWRRDYPGQGKDAKEVPSNNMVLARSFSAGYESFPERDGGSSLNLYTIHGWRPPHFTHPRTWQYLSTSVPDTDTAIFKITDYRDPRFRRIWVRRATSKDCLGPFYHSTIPMIGALLRLRFCHKRILVRTAANMV